MTDMSLDEPRRPTPSAAPAEAPSSAGGRFLSGVLAASFIGVIWGMFESAARLIYYHRDSQVGIRAVPRSSVMDNISIVVLSGFQYAILGAVIGVLAMIFLAPVLRVFKSKSAQWRAFVAPRFAMWFGAVFFNLFWWSRFYIDFARQERFYSSKRLLLSLGWAVVALVVAAVVVAVLLRLRRRSSASGFRTAVIAAVLLLGLVGWVREQVLLSDQPEKGDSPGRYNVVLFVIDALRAQQLGCYGYERDTSPNIDALAKEGVLFERAVVQAPYTWTSFGTLFTGKWPREHGLMKMDPTVAFNPVSNNTVQSVLDGYHYRTGAFLTGMLSNASGLIDGFETYFESTVGRDPVRRSSVWSFYRSELVLRALLNKVRQAVDPTLVTDEAIAWIRENKDARFLSVVHLYSTHTTYDPPDEFDIFSPGYQGDLDKFSSAHAIEIHTGRWEPSAEDEARIRDLYDGGVLFADHQVGMVMDALREEGVLDDTIVVITSDHGEELGEHGVWEHNWMYNTNLLAPLIVRMPKGEGAGIRVDTPVEYRDVLPTVLDLLELRSTYEKGVGAVDWKADGYTGESLRDWFRGLRPKDDDLAVTENGKYVAVQNRRYKLVKRKEEVEADPPRLYDLERDPEEYYDIYQPDHPALPPLLKQWQDYCAIVPPEQQTHALDNDALRLLGQLGYVGEFVAGESVDEGALAAEKQKKDIAAARKECDCGAVCIEPRHKAYCDCDPDGSGAGCFKPVHKAYCTCEGGECRNPNHKPPESKRKKTP